MKIYKNNNHNFITKLNLDNLRKKSCKLGTLCLSTLLISTLIACNDISIDKINTEISSHEQVVDTTIATTTENVTETKISLTDIPTTENVTYQETTEIIDSYIDIEHKIKNDMFDIKKFSINHNSFTVSDELYNKINTLIKTYPNNSAFYIVSLDGEFSMGYNIDDPIFAACVVKAPYAMYCFKELEKGNGTLDELITYKEKHYKGGTGIIKNAKFGTQYKIEEILFHMLNISDNVAYYMMQDRYPIKGYNEMLSTFDCKVMPLNGRRFGDVTAREILLLWNAIYEYSQESTYGSKLFDILLGAQFNYIKDAIPEYEVAHKSGWSDLARNDAGILSNEEPYLITVLTSNQTGEKDKQYFKDIVVTANEIINEYNAFKKELPTYIKEYK